MIQNLWLAAAGGVVGYVLFAPINSLFSEKPPPPILYEVSSISIRDLGGEGCSFVERRRLMKRVDRFRIEVENPEADRKLISYSAGASRMIDYAPGRTVVVETPCEVYAERFPSLEELSPGDYRISFYTEQLEGGSIARGSTEPDTTIEATVEP